MYAKCVKQVDVLKFKRHSVGHHQSPLKLFLELTQIVMTL